MEYCRVHRLNAMTDLAATAAFLIYYIGFFVSIHHNKRQIYTRYS